MASILYVSSDEIKKALRLRAAFSNTSIDAVTSVAP